MKEEYGSGDIISKRRYAELSFLYATLRVDLLFTWLSLVMSMMVSFCAVLFPTRCLG